MRVILATTSWSLLIRALAALALAVLLLILREISLSYLVLLFFGYTMIDGVVNLAGAITAAQSHQRPGSLLLEAIGGMSVGLISVACCHVRIPPAAWRRSLIAVGQRNADWPYVQPRLSQNPLFATEADDYQKRRPDPSLS
jgi:hypothetical protein